MGRVRISDVQLSDFSKIIEIEKVSFPSPWDFDTFLSTYVDSRCKAIVARRDEKIMGYCFSVDMENMLHVLNLAVNPAFRRMGIARRLIYEMSEFAKNSHKNAILLEVRVNNLPARSLYLSMGFTSATTWHGYYADTGEDAFIMVKRIDDCHE